MSAFLATFGRARLEEVAERFHREIERLPDGRLRLPFADLTLAHWQGRPLTAAALTALARARNLASDDLGILVDPKEPIEGQEDALLGLLSALLEDDPASFLRLPAREIAVPAAGDFPESRRWLERFYGEGAIPREKKPIVFDLGQSQGPYLRSIDRDPLQLLDSASQIASLPAGVRPGLVQAALDDGRFDPHLLCAEDTRRGDTRATVDFADALTRHAAAHLRHVSLTNGGSEAIEKALHLARRFGRGGSRVVAFEGSFHGRTLVPLFSTWNEEKRAPYQLTGFETLWAPFPLASPGVDVTFPPAWQAAWSSPEGAREFVLTAPASGEDPDVDRARLVLEIESLDEPLAGSALEVKASVVEGVHYAEPLPACPRTWMISARLVDPSRALETASLMRSVMPASRARRRISPTLLRPILMHSWIAGSTTISS